MNYRVVKKVGKGYQIGQQSYTKAEATSALANLKSKGHKNVKIMSEEKCFGGKQ